MTVLRNVLALILWILAACAAAPATYAVFRMMEEQVRLYRQGSFAWETVPALCHANWPLAIWLVLAGVLAANATLVRILATVRS